MMTLRSHPARLACAVQAGIAALSTWGLARMLAQAGLAPALAGALGLGSGLLVPVLLHGTMLFGGFFGSWLLGGRRGSWPGWLATWMVEWSRSMRVTYGMLAWRENFRLATRTDSPAGPIVLVHGYAANRGLWLRLAPCFAASGRRLILPSLRPFTAGIDELLPQLAAAIEGAREAAPGRPVHLVAHSMGGLLVRAYLKRQGWAGLGAVVMMGTPQRGTWQALFGPGRAARQMRRGSAWLDELARGEPQVPPGRLLLITSERDNVVSWPDIQTLPGARRVRLHRLGHLGFVFEPRLVLLSLRFIERAERSPVSPP